VRTKTNILSLSPNIYIYIYIHTYIHTHTRTHARTHTQGVSKTMSPAFLGHSPLPLKHKSSYQHGSKSEHVPRAGLTFMCWYPFDYCIRYSKCWPFAATHPLRRRIMDSLTHSSWLGRFLMASNVATMRSHNSSTLVTVVE
jgi:hypothetical protein